MQTAKFSLKENVTYQIFDKDGNIKPVFQPYKIVQLLVKHGWLSPFHPKNLLFGFWGNSMELANTVTNAGKADVAALINGAASPNPFDYIGVGTGTTAAAATDTTLETEIVDSGLSRAQGTASQTTTDVTDDTAQVTKSFSVTGTKAVTESGLFNAASVGTMLARQVFSALNVVNGDTLAVTWKIDVD